MEYLILFVSYWAVPIITTRYILPKDDLLMMSTFKSIVMPYITIAAFIFVLTLIMNIIRAIRTCPVEKDQPRPWGLSGGIKLGIFSSVFAALMYLVVGMFPVLTLPFVALSILPYSTEIGEGFYVALGAFLGYWFGRPFIGLC